MAVERPDAIGPSEALPCTGLRVVDATGEFGAYAGRLLADLGADVVRLVPPGKDPLEKQQPFVATTDGATRSAFAWFVSLNKRAIRIDLACATGRDRLRRLLGDSDVLLESWTRTEREQLELDAILAEAPPTLVRVSVTPFGGNGPWADRPATDLTTLASGGLLALGGYPDAEPVAAHGGQSLLAASIFGAVAALLGVVSRQRDGLARHLDVSAQEAVAAALEDAIPQFDLTGRVRRRFGGDPREAGTGILACQDGYVSMVAGRLGTARAWRALTAWLIEEEVPGADELAGEAWSSHAYRQRPGSIARFQEIFERFAADRTKQDLYLEAQRRSIALAPVNTIAEVVKDPQLAAREFFRSVTDPAFARPVLVPGRPYRLDGGGDFTPRPMVVEAPAAPADVESGAAAGASEAHDWGTA